MEILGVGPMELIAILVIALIVLGPNDMVKAGKTLGKFMRKVVMSPTWRAVQQTSREIRYLPNRLMREAGLENEIKDLKQVQSQLSQQIEEIRSLKAPLAAAAAEVNTAAGDLNKEINQEAQTIGSDLGAWVTPADSQPPAAETINALPESPRLTRPTESQPEQPTD